MNTIVQQIDFTDESMDNIIQQIEWTDVLWMK